MSVMQAWLWLGLAIVLEVSGTMCMKLSAGFTRLLPTALIAVFYAASFTAMVMSLKRIDLGVAYAVWAGIGTALVAALGILVFREAAATMKLIAILLIISGVVMLHLSGGDAR